MIQSTCILAADVDGSFAKEEDLLEFASAIRASDTPDPELEFIVTSMSEWQAPPRQTLTRKASVRTADEGREGFSYRLLRWPAFVPHPTKLGILILDFGIGLVGMASVTAHGLCV